MSYSTSRALPGLHHLIKFLLHSDVWFCRRYFHRWDFWLYQTSVKGHGMGEVAGWNLAALGDRWWWGSSPAACEGTHTGAEDWSQRSPKRAETDHNPYFPFFYADEGEEVENWKQRRVQKEWWGAGKVFLRFSGFSQRPTLIHLVVALFKLDWFCFLNLSLFAHAHNWWVSPPCPLSWASRLSWCFLFPIPREHGRSKQAAVWCFVTGYMGSHHGTIIDHPGLDAPY